jgi:hypothetical protein
MKKATLRLGIRRETIKVLAELDLARAAAGGPDAQLMDTGDIARTCVVQAVPNTGNAGTKA